MTNSENQTHEDPSTGTDTPSWGQRLEELLKVKSVEDLKAELTKLAGELQTEIQNFDLNAHLSPTAKARLKSVEKRYAEVIKTIGQLQRQLDRELNKSLRVLKRTRQEAEKQILDIKAKITKHRGTIVRASSDWKQRLKRATTKKKTPKAPRKSKAKKAKG